MIGACVRTRSRERGYYESFTTSVSQRAVEKTVVSVSRNASIFGMFRSLPSGVFQPFQSRFPNEYTKFQLEINVLVISGPIQFPIANNLTFRLETISMTINNQARNDCHSHNERISRDYCLRNLFFSHSTAALVLQLLCVRQRRLLILLFFSLSNCMYNITSIFVLFQIQRRDAVFSDDT